jgi:predicted transcriptional regulator
MATEVLKLTAQIVMSHASMSELSPEELVDEIKEVYSVLSSLEASMPEDLIMEKPGEGEVVKKPPVPLKDIVKAKYVICLECGKKMKTLKTHLRKAHNLMPKDYYQRFGLDPKKFPLVCKDYSEQRSRMAKERGFGEKGGRRKASK